MTLIYPFAAFLATSLPKVEDVYLHVPMYGHEDWYCDQAHGDLHTLLKYGRIKRLHHAFSGPEVANTLKDKDSQACFEDMMGTLPKRVIDHRFELLHPEPKNSGRKQMLKYYDAMDENWEKRKDSFAGDWEWGARDIDFGSGGNVQAVITMNAP